MRSFVDFWVRIQEFAGNMKFIFVCFTLLVGVVLLPCFVNFLPSNLTYLDVAGCNGDHHMC